ncbi:hypothetical protein IE53DRAFT_371067 [Violaceomyces palustris]|uniref:Uncharacterized protein n=1 Tax=Violaceomyces palustris TaxID=1673888 RepID=A0ACD0NQ28_9BASI|nr:hypothetical protein IE53DRAFT_371067 [Violaceomyces palustris]
MASSRRAQIRSLCGPTGPLVDRTESYVAAIDIWAGQGNAKAIKNVGPGLVAICAWLAAESLESDKLDKSTAERASGLTPAQFRNAEKDLRLAIQALAGITRSPSRRRRRTKSTNATPTPSNPSTPTKSQSGTPSNLGTPSGKRKLALTEFDPKDRSPEALRAKAQAAQSGALFGLSTPTKSPGNRLKAVGGARKQLSDPSSPASSSAQGSPSNGKARQISNPDQVIASKVATAAALRSSPSTSASASLASSITLTPRSTRSSNRPPTLSQDLNVNPFLSLTMTPTKSRLQNSLAQPHTPSRSSPLKRSSAATLLETAPFFEEDDEEDDQEEASLFGGFDNGDADMGDDDEDDSADSEGEEEDPRLGFAELVQNVREPDEDGILEKEPEVKLRKVLERILPSLDSSGEEPSWDDEAYRDEMFVWIPI